MQRLADDVRERRARSSLFEYVCFTAPPFAAMSLLLWLGGSQGYGRTLAVPILIGGLVGAFFVLISAREPIVKLNAFWEVTLSLFPAAFFYVVFGPDWWAVLAMAVIHVIHGEMERRSRPPREQARVRSLSLRRRLRRVRS